MLKVVIMNYKNLNPINSYFNYKLYNMIILPITSYIVKIEILKPRFFGNNECSDYNWTSRCDPSPDADSTSGVGR